ncbi:ankyrin-2-like [Trichogramma pretiosum]|uniref:ankyrin-2-like n=1 Tax=Trichogramma pretiosum TaxID=7493 RepID=UPI000C71C13C|nr:ankyrin-2-like [Trichogramma pretiosum]XP_023317025.1 ankyrin-2-like [Trichogramma pretiosum]
MRSQNGILLHGNHFDVKDIINRPEEFIRPDESGHSLLHTACEISDIESVEKIISVNGSNLKNAIDMKGLSHFHVVAISSYTDVLERFLKENVVPDINAAISDTAKFLPGFTALHIACLRKNVEHVRVLLKYGAHSNVKNAFGHTPYELLLWESVRLNRLIMDPETIRYFCTKSKYKKYIEKFKIDKEKDCKIPLRNVYKMIRLILKAAKGNKEFDDKGFSRLHFLVCQALLPNIELEIKKNRHLVNAKVSEDVQFYGGLTPLHLAAYFHYDDIVSFLLKHGADPHIKTNQDENALTLRLMDFYKAFENDPDFQNKSGKRSSLIPSLMNPSLLLNHPDFIDKFGMKTIHLAVGTDLDFFEKFYLSERPNIDELVSPTESKYNYYEGNTPLHLAVMFKRYDIANYLIKNGANVNIANKSGDTPVKLYRRKERMYNLEHDEGDINFYVKT